MNDIATRDAYGKALLKLGEENPRIVVLDADLSGSTKTNLFAQKFPERFFNMGVAEQDMMGTAAGLALTDKIVFASSFAMFAAGRAWEIVRNSIVYPHLNVKICASHSGLTVGEDGASHQIVSDIAIMRVIPTMSVFVPADGPETEQIIAAVAAFNGPCYVRLGRPKVPVLFDENYQFKIGKGNVIREGKKVAIIACGIMVAAALQAADLLKQQGIVCTVVNLASIKPIDKDLILQIANAHDLIVTAEEHTTMGGMGSAVAEVVVQGKPVRMKMIGVQDEFGQSAPAEVLLKHYHLTAEDIAKTVKDSL